MSIEESSQEEDERMPLLLRDDIARIFYADRIEEYVIYSSYVIVLRLDDPIQKWISQGEDIAHWLNPYSGNILITTIEYIKAYINQRPEVDLRQRLITLYSVPDEVIDYSLDPDVITDYIKDNNFNIREEEYDRVNEIIQNSFSLQSLPIRYGLENIISTSLALYYTEDESIFSFENMLLNRTIVVARKGQEVRVYDYPPSIENLWEHTKATRTEDMGEDDIMFYLYSDKTGYVTAYYNQNGNFLVIRGVDADFPSFNLLGLAYAHDLTKITSRWELYDMPLELDMFLYALTRINKSEILEGISIDETAPYFLKKEVNLIFALGVESYRFIIRTEVFSTLNKEYVRPLLSEEREGILDSFVKDFPAGTPYVTITVHDVKNTFILNTVKNVLSIAIYRFIHELQEDFIHYHQEIFSDFEPEYSWARRSDKKLKKLQNAAPEMFGYKYSKRCQEKNQGVIIPDDKLDEWKKEHPYSEYITYPVKPVPGVKRINYGCPDPRFPKTGLKRNTSNPNSDIYPYVPCCYADDKKAAKGSAYKEYISPNSQFREPTVEEISRSHFRPSESTNKFLGFSKLAHVSESLREKFTKSGITGEILRRGAHPTINSFIHCIFQAVVHMDYFSFQYMSEMEIFVQKWRQEVLLQNVNLEVVMQEMYGYSREDIQRIIQDPKGRFDSSLLYRLLEVYFGVNIFVFRETSSTEPVSIEIPRHRVVHIRDPRLDLPSIIIFKYSRGAKDEEAYYELIRIDGNILFGSTITQKLFFLFGELYSSYIIQSPNSIQIDPYNTYSVHRMLLRANMIIRGQHIDFYGKCRGFIVETPIGEIGSVLCMPQQPINTKSFMTIQRFSSKILSLFPPFISIDETGSGVWIPVNEVKLGIYLPLSDIENVPIPFDIIPRTSSPIYIPENYGEFYYFTKRADIVNHILKFITILYREYVNSLPIFERTEENKLKFIDRFDVDLNVIYDFDRHIVYNEPLETTGLLRNDIIILPSEKMLDDIIYYTERYLIKQPDKFYSTDPIIEINRFNTIEEFYIWLEVKVKPKQIITNAKDLTFGFAEEEGQKGKKGKRRKKIEEISTATIYPYPRFYLDPSGSFFIVQNVLQGHRDRAISVSLLWLREGVNRGYHTDILEPLPEPNQYTIAGRQITAPSVNNNLPSILRYSDDSYAALLPIVPLI